MGTTSRNRTVSSETREQIQNALMVAGADRVADFLADFVDDVDALDGDQIHRAALSVLIDSVLDGVNSASDAVAVARDLAGVAS